MAERDDGLFSKLSATPPSNLLDSDGDTQLDGNIPADQSIDNTSISSSEQQAIQIKNFAPARDEISEETSSNNQDSCSTEDNQKEFPTTPSNESSSVTPVLRRSSRANKGIGKEIFDPSHIPSAKKKYHEPIRFDSPNSGRSSSSPSSLSTSSGSKKSRIVIEGGPRRRHFKNLNRSIAEKKLQQRLKKAKKEMARKTNNKTEIKKPISAENFSDEDDNVPLKKLKTEDVSADDDKSDDSSSTNDVSDPDSDDSYNNPGRLWCICKKPHNNKFMISCDQCEDWFHGECVGISLQRGKKMEENNEEYVCPKCRKVKNEDSLYIPDQEEGKEKNLLDDPKAHKRSITLDQKLLSRKSLKGYALYDKSSLNKSDSSNKQPQSKETDHNRDPTVSEDKTSSSIRKCIVSSCHNDALSGSVYCSNQCILKHAKESLKTVVQEKEKSESKLTKEKNENGNKKALNPNRRIPVICRKTRKVLSGPAAPRRKDLSAFLKNNPTYKIFKPSSLTDNSKPVKLLSNKEEGKTQSTDFYKHVEHQQRKRDRYGNPEPPSAFSKKASHATSLDKKHRVIKAVSQSKPSNPYKLNSEGGKLLHQSKFYQSLKSNDRPTMKKHRKEVEDRKQEGYKREEKDQKRKLSLDSSKTTLDPKKVVRSLSSGSKPSKSDSKSGVPDVRRNVKKSLFDILKTRSENSDDLKMHPDSIMRLAAKVEESLFKVYEDTNTKYKNKYRSMMFNLKDSRNHGLWRKVIIGEVTTAEFVLMTAEQMASKKLAEWRKNELTQELDIIQKQEKEVANIRPVAKITHKGEIAIQEDLSDLTENFSSREAGPSPTVAPVRKKRLSLSEDDPFEGSGSTLPSDTTSQHNEHLFDLNCKICTGKMKEEDLELTESSTDTVKKVKRSTSIILSTEAQSASSNKEKTAAPKSHIVISREDKKKKKKKEKKFEESNINSHDRSLSPTTFLSNLSKKKKKPILPAPPPLSEMAELEVAQETKSPKNDTEVKDNCEPETKASEPKPPTPESTSPALTQASPIPEPPPKSNKLIWSGTISMLELSTFKANVYPANGCCDNLDIDLPVRLVLGGRIHPKVVWEYLIKICALPNKQLSVVRFHAASDDDRVGYVAMLSYFSSRKRFGVVNNQDRMLVKDMYILPLLESHSLPPELVKCSPGIEQALTSSRPSMLIGVVVRQIAAKPLKSVPDPIKSSSVNEDDEVVASVDGNKEYIPDDEPPIKESKPSPTPLLTDEELAAKTSNKSQKSTGSLLERNRSLAPSLRFFMRKQSEEEQSKKEGKLPEEEDDDRPYSPGEDIDQEDDDKREYDPEEGILQDDVGDEEPYDPEKMFPEEEEYDPETAFPPISPKTDENTPYDPEDENLMEESVDSNDVKEIVEKQASIERMQRELEEKKAKLAQVEQSLQKSTPSLPVEKPRIMDPRLAKRAAKESDKLPAEAPKPVQSSIVPASIPVTSSSIIPPTSLDPPTSTSSSLSPALSESKPGEVNSTLKSSDPIKSVDPLQTILSVLNMGQTKSSSSNSSVLGALKIFQKHPSAEGLHLNDSMEKEKVNLNETNEDLEEESTEMNEIKKTKEARCDGSKMLEKKEESESSNKTINNHGDNDDERRNEKSERKRRRSSSVSSSSSREENRRRHHRHDDSRHNKRHKRSRSRSPHRRERHHRRHDDDHRRHHDRSHGRDRRR